MESDRLANLALSSKGFLFDTKTGYTYTLNKTGAFILKCLIDGVDLTHLVEKLTERFDGPEAVATRDLDQFLTRLHSLDLLTDCRSQDVPNM